ncbi:hypothetical protein Tco_0823122 [Tanacetum coccineum]|uniref:Uncharacterized protein n=1 Tax=Tanacetum coccineum TaxID=301880 RepID=A0ABQ5ALC4_9ASTR
MKNANPPLTHPVLPVVLRVQFNQELQELQKISAFIDSRLESIEQFLNRFTEQPNETSINDPEPDNGLVDTPLVSPFPHSDNDSDDEEVLNELCEKFHLYHGFVVLEDIGEFIMSDMAEVLMGRPFSKTFDTYTYRMPRTIPRLKNFNWSKVPPLLELSQNDLMNKIRYFSFGRHLEELHVTWAHLEKKRTRLRTYTNIDQEFLYSGWRWRHRYNVTPSP